MLVMLDPQKCTQKPSPEIIGHQSLRMRKRATDISIKEYIESHLKGQAICPAYMVGGMKNENFVSQEVMEIDSDGGQTMEAVLEIAKRTEIYPVAIYPTFSHDPEAGKHKFRMVFKLPFPVTDKRLRRAIMHSLLKLFKIEVDRHDYSPSAIYQGTNKTLFFDKSHKPPNHFGQLDPKLI